MEKVEYTPVETDEWSSTLPENRRRPNRSLFVLAVSFTFMVISIVYFVTGYALQGPSFGVSSVPVQFPTKVVTFEPNLENTWDQLIPPGKGFIEVEYPHEWGLNGGYPIVNGSTPYSEAYCISAFHQIHCLATINTAVSQYLLWKSGASSPEMDHSKDMHDVHLNHCVDYIRQAIMCAGDSTLEKAQVFNGELRYAVDGWNVQHQCRDWNALYDYAVDKRGKAMPDELIHVHA